MRGKDTVSFGVVGVGNMGGYHANNLLSGKIRNARLVAVADIDVKRLEPFKDKVKIFSNHRQMIASGLIDAVIIATPHYDHTIIGIDVLKAGLHLLVEKPISVHKADCEKLIAAHKSKRQIFAAMFNQRTDPHYIKLKHLIKEKELGRIMRINWIITNWFRTNSYYASGGWRATWRGEGGGVLMNQCPHQLDLMQWLFGMPTRVRACCYFGKYHPIEVEDEVTAFLEYSGGATGVFITSTGEAPGTNRLEVIGERGKVVVEYGKIEFTRNTISAAEFCASSPQQFGAPDIWQINIPADGYGGQHTEVLQNFVDAILKGTRLIARAEEGMNSVELANAMLWSALKDDWVELPFSSAKFVTALKNLINKSKVKKDIFEKVAGSHDMAKSF
jgi:predicted dehydrogenase